MRITIPQTPSPQFHLFTQTIHVIRMYWTRWGKDLKFLNQVPEWTQSWKTRLLLQPADNHAISNPFYSNHDLIQAPIMQTKVVFVHVGKTQLEQKHEDDRDYLPECTHITFKGSTEPFEIRHHFTCDTRNVIYALTCQGCGDNYIGKTEREVRDRCGEYRVAGMFIQKYKPCLNVLKL